MLAALALAAAARTAPAPGVADVVAVLERDAATGAPDARLAADLGALGPVHAPDLFAVLAFGPGPERSLEGREEGALTQALASFGAASVRTLLKQRLAKEPAPEERLAVLRVLLRVGTSEDVPLLRKSLQAGSGGLLDALEEAGAGMLGRDARALEALRRWMLEAPIEVGATLAHALVASSCPGAPLALARTLGFRAELDAGLLEELGSLLARAPKPVDPEVLQPIEEALGGDDELVLRAAARALGHAQDADALQRLIGLLENPSLSVSAAAEEALGEITGLRFRADVGRWRAWLRAEEAWLAENGRRLRAELVDPAPAVAIRALGELSSHRWRRHELALTVATALEHADARVRCLACTVLARLGSSAAAPALERALEDEDEAVARAAREALQALGLTASEPGGPDTAFLGQPSRNRPMRSRKRRIAA